MDDSRVKAASEVLSAFFDEEKLRRGGRYAEFFASWKFLVGEQLAAHSHVADIKNGVLFIEAEHPGWIQLLQLRQSAVLTGIANRFPEFGLRSIAFRLGSPRPPIRDRAGIPEKEGTGLPSEGAEASAWDDSKAAEAGPRAPSKSLEEIDDPTLKAVLTSLRDSMDEGKRGPRRV
ncbi:MAG TPA: DUF721 domain-containing protein [Rectinemataceae bacterium]|nr:DUF721 domain-containing protein [Rectinemataceae bacterium]